MIIPNLLRALEFAANKHMHERRKGSDHAPYINHPIEVAAVLSVEAGHQDEALLVAAILHDTVEDTSTSFEEIEQHFGAEVSSLVKEMTDDTSLPKQRRKELQIEHAPTLTDGAKRLKLADKIANVRDMGATPPEEWPHQRRIDYLDWTEAVIAGVRGVDETLEQIYDEALAQARYLLNQQA